MNKAELIVRVADRARLNKVQARDAVESFLACVTASLKAGQQVRLVGFGAFVPVERAAGPTRNPKTGKTVHRRASRTARFRIGEALKSALN